MNNSETAFNRTHPLGFELYDDNDQKVFYIDDDPQGYNLNLEIENTSNRTIEIPAGKAPANVNNHHFELVFRPGTLSKTSITNITLAESDWKTGKNKNKDGTVSLFILGTQSLTLAPGGKLRLTLQHVNADGGGGSRGTRVEFRYRQLNYKNDTESLSGNRVQFMNIVNRQGKKNIPLHVGMVGSGTVLNDGQTPNELTLCIVNVLKEGYISLNTADSEAPSKFILSFRAGDEEWALGTVNQAAGIDIEAKKRRGSKWVNDPAWEIEKDTQGQSPEWVITSKSKTSLNAGEEIHLELSDIITSHPAGYTLVRVNYENIPGYWDGRFLAVIQKSPLVYRGGNVGIGTDEPKGKLHNTGDYYGKGHLYLHAYEGDGKDGWTYIQARDDSGKSTIGLQLRTQNQGKIKDAVTITPTGNVGIGVVNPSALLEVKGRIKDETGFVMPQGGIIVWSGKESQIPPGWVLCDGRNGTPDLRDRFIVGAGENYRVGNRGGETSVTLTEKQMPVHTHSGSVSSNGQHSHWIEGTDADGLAKRKRRYAGTTTVDMGWGGGSNADPGNEQWRGMVDTDTQSAHSHTITIKTAGADYSHENRPPYYALCFIMKR